MPRAIPRSGATSATTEDLSSETPRVATGRADTTTSLPTIDPAALANLLDRDGTAVLIEQFLSTSSADELFCALMEHVAWEQFAVTMFGKVRPVPRQMAWFGSSPYDYSGVHHDAAPWPSVLVPLRDQLSTALGVDFNTVLLNRHVDGTAKVGWHADDEPIFGVDPTIASVSLGGSRRFRMRHRDSGSTQTVVLDHGSLLVMAGAMQRHWRHGIPATARPVAPRVNLTFRHAVY